MQRHSITLVIPKRRNLVLHKRHSLRMPQIREHHHPIPIVLARTLAHLPQSQLHLPLIHPQDHAVLIDGLPYLRPPVLVQLMRVVVEQNLVRIERVLPRLPIPHRHRILLLVVRLRKHHQHLLIPTRNPKRSRLRSHLLHEILHHHRLRPQQRARRLPIVRRMSGIRIKIQLPARRNPNRRPHQLLHISQRSRPLLLQVDQIVIRNLLPLRSLHVHRSIPLPIDQPHPHPNRQHHNDRGPNRRLHPILHPQSSVFYTLHPTPYTLNPQAPQRSTPVRPPSKTPPSRHPPSSTAETTRQPKPSPPSTQPRRSQP